MGCHRLCIIIRGNFREGTEDEIRSQLSPFAPDQRGKDPEKEKKFDSIYDLHTQHLPFRQREREREIHTCRIRVETLFMLGFYLGLVFLIAACYCNIKMKHNCHFILPLPCAIKSP
jgi:hypothetical protein